MLFRSSGICPSCIALVIRSSLLLAAEQLFVNTTNLRFSATSLEVRKMCIRDSLYIYGADEPHYIKIKDDVKVYMVLFPVSYTHLDVYKRQEKKSEISVLLKK